VTIAFLSGMRDSEIKHLHRGCLRTHKDPTGAAYRWTLDSLAFKGERDPAGVPATWVVGQPVAAAISILERLQTSPNGFLFTALPYSGGAGPARLLSQLSSDLENDESATQRVQPVDQ